MRLASLFLAALLTSHAQDVGQDGFNGTWLRDDIVATDGKQLPRVTWVISFTRKTLTRVESSGQTASRTVTYDLDGLETSSNNTSHRLVTRQNGFIQIAEVTSIVDGSTLRISETWTLSNKGKTLKMVRKIQTPDIPIRAADVVYTFQRTQGQ